MNERAGSGFERAIVGIDVGGTFTDLVMFDPAAQSLSTVKVPSAPPEFWPSVVAALREAGVGADRPTTVLHGTTVHLNAFLERKGARTALVTTAGFRDVYEMRRGNRPTPYDIHFRYPTPLVPRHHVYEVDERTAADGTVLRAAESAPVVEMAHRLAGEGIESVAVCLLHSYRNPANERLVADAIRRAEPHLFVSASHEICREWREYERTSTTVINAYVSPVLATYLKKLTGALAEWRDIRLFLLQSNGGLISAEEARSKGILTLLSGPVGGNVAGRAAAAGGSARNLICIDMGGTSFEASLIVEGESAIRTEREVGGFPVLAPMVDIHTIGAGGGSIAWSDNGSLRVGPQSAAARPGPAAYGFGGMEATVTDANLALGRLTYESSFAADLKLQPELAQAAISRISTQFGLDPQTTAQGILDVINERMANAIRTITVRRGIDPRQFSLVAYGGAGPMHAADIARLLGIRRVIVPRAAGAFSAWGMLQSDLMHDVAETTISPLATVDWSALESRFAEIERELAVTLVAEGASNDSIEYKRALDIRYVGQEYSIPVPIDGDPSTLPEQFSRLYEATYGHSSPEEALEISTLRLRAVSRSSLDPNRLASAKRSGEDTRTPYRMRPVRFGGMILETPFVSRAALEPGRELDGPIVIEESTCTTVVPPEFMAVIDAEGNLVLNARATGSREDVS